MAERPKGRFTRRQVLATGLQMGLGAIGLGAAAAMAAETDKAFGGRFIALPARNALDSLTQTAEQVADQAPPYIQTALKTAGYTVTELLAAPVVSKVYGAPIGSRVSETDVAIVSRAGFIKSLNGFLPTTAQEVGRWLLSFSLPGKLADDWRTGVVQAAGGAMISNVQYGPNPDNPQSHEPVYFKNGKLPLFQGFEQFYFWRLMRERGLPHALLAHSVNLGLKLVAARLLNKASRPLAANFVPLTMEATSSDEIKASVMAKFLRIVK